MQIQAALSRLSELKNRAHEAVVSAGREMRGTGVDLVKTHYIHVPSSQTTKSLLWKDSSQEIPGCVNLTAKTKQHNSGADLIL